MDGPLERRTPLSPEAEPFDLLAPPDYRDSVVEAYKKESYIEPPGESAIDYSKRILTVDPADQWARDMIASSVKAEKSLILNAAVEGKDFAAAHRKANALKQLLPDRNVGAELDKEITNLENAGANAHRPTPPGIGMVDVYTTPAGRRVYVDGKYVGISPVVGLSLRSTRAPSQRGKCLGRERANRELPVCRGQPHLPALDGNCGLAQSSPEPGKPLHLVEFLPQSGVGRASR